MANFLPGLFAFILLIGVGEASADKRTVPGKEAPRPKAHCQKEKDCCKKERCVHAASAQPRRVRLAVSGGSPSAQWVEFKQTR